MNKVEGKKAIGSMVHVSDGTPRPPEHFNKKLATWKHSNYSGILTEVKPSWDNRYTNCEINTQTYSFAVFNMSVDLAEVQHGEHPLAPAHETVKM